MTNPVTGYLADRGDETIEEKLAASKTRKIDEIAQLNKWKAGGQQPKDLEPLLNAYDGVFNQKLRAWKPPNVPASAFKSELQIHAIKAFLSYDPSRGAALNTHVENRLHKAKRYGNNGANLLRIPEGIAGGIGKINKAREKLTEELGHPPTTQEIAHHVGMPVKRVQTTIDAQHFTVPMGRSAGEETYDYGSGSEATGHDFEDAQIAIAHQILPSLLPKAEHREVFLHIYGLDDHKQISGTGDLARYLGKSSSQIARAKTHIGNVLKAHMGFASNDDDD